MRAPALAAALLALVSTHLLVAYAQNESNPLTRVEGIANQVASALKNIAYAVITIAAFIGVIHYAFGRGPEWLGRAVMAAVALSVVLWIIGQFMG